jgi:DNA-binding phage protein
MKPITRKALSEMLAGLNVEDVAREADISPKTVYRYRWQKSAPTLDNLGRVLDAIAAVRKRKQKTEAVHA